MKSFLTITLCLVLTLLITKPIFAQNNNPATPSATPSVETVQYNLPYPGILPDHPLYFLKSLRDRIVATLISDSSKKAEFYLLKSDKYLNEAIFLTDKGRDDKAEESIIKSNDATEETLKAIDKALSEQKDLKGVPHNLETSLKKHEQVLKNLKTKMNKEYSQNIDKELKRIERSTRQLNEYLAKIEK